MALIWNYLREWCLEVNIIFMEWENIGTFDKTLHFRKKEKKNVKMILILEGRWEMVETTLFKLV